MRAFLIIFLFYYNIFFSQQKAFVIAIKDGDTIVVLDSLKNQHTLRLAEVDCPESGQAFGKNAKQYVSSQVFKKNITYYPINTDRYGRTIAKVYYDNGKYLSKEIIKNGFGWWYYKYSDDKSLGELQQKAQQQKIGLFSDKNAVAPWVYRQHHRRL